ncbi:MAG: homocysteine S-methyltransferase family protein, partial [Anaerobacillus sp.]
MAYTSFEDLLKRRILVLDGAMGTMIQQANLSAPDFGGEEYEGCNEYLSLTRPDLISSIHDDYLAAGADIIETNTFGATDLVLEEYNLGEHAEKLNYASALLAKEAAARVSTADKPRYVAGAIGPTTKTLSVTGGTTFEALSTSYAAQAKG